MAGEHAALHAIVRGAVQGVGYRDFAVHQARRLGLAGYVRNLPDGRSVEVVVEGDRSSLARLEQLLREGPPAASVQSVNSTWARASGRYTSFDIEW